MIFLLLHEAPNEAFNFWPAVVIPLADAYRSNAFADLEAVKGAFFDTQNGHNSYPVDEVFHDVEIFTRTRMPILKPRQDLLQELDNTAQCEYEEIVFHPVLDLLLQMCISAAVYSSRFLYIPQNAPNFRIQFLYNRFPDIAKNRPLAIMDCENRYTDSVYPLF
jgi:hypothetical protein